MPRSLPVPDAVHERLARPPLKAMLGQLRFPRWLRFSDPTALASFQGALAAEFPETEEEELVGLALGPEESAPRIAQDRNLRFRTADRAWSVVLNLGSITLEAEAAQYTSYTEFRARFGRVWEMAIECFQPPHATQQGLRYIDHIERELSGPDWRRFINPELLGPVGGPPLGSFIEESLQNLVLRVEHGTLTCRHGVARAGPENNPGYLIDLDYFSRGTVPDLGVESVLSTFDVFHEELYALFRWAITEEAMDEFRGRD